MPFTDAPLAALQQISAEQQPITAEDLKRLQTQIQSALSIPDESMRALKYSEMIWHAAKYGHGAVCVGGFVIKRR